MQVIIFKKQGQEKPIIWSEGLNLSAAKKKLREVYIQSIEQLFEDLNPNDGISKDSKELTICNNYFWIERDTRL